MSGEGSKWTVLPLYLDSVVYPEWHPRAGAIGPVYAFLLESDDYLVLVDSGIGSPHPVIDQFYAPTRRDLPTALGQNNGIGIDDISAMILTHLHFDHVGGAQHFRGTPLYVQHSEWESAQQPSYTIPEFLDFPHANFVLLDGEVELAPGLRIIPTPGHTPGHQIVAVETPAGRFVIAGQAVETVSEYTQALSGEAPATESVGVIAGLAPIRVLFSHDHANWRLNG